MYAFKSTDILFDSDCWYADPWASEYMSDNRTLFNNMKPIQLGKRLIKGVGKNNKALQAARIGRISLAIKVDSEWYDGT